MPTAAPENSAKPEVAVATRFGAPRLVPLLLALAVVLLIFLPAVRFGFVRWDDYDTILRNPRMMPTAQSLRLIWTHSYMGLYVPLTSTIWWLLGAISRQPDPHVFHALNLLLHLGACAAVFLLLDRLLKSSWLAAAGALLFAIHPVQVETVAWISGTKDLLCGLLVIVALGQWVNFAQADFDRRKLAHYVLATICMILACLAKPTALVLPLMALALSSLILQSRLWRAMRWLWPWFVMAVPCVIWTRVVQSPRFVESTPLLLRPVIASDAIAFYLHKLVCPFALSVDYGRTPREVLAHWGAYWTLPLVIFLLAALWLMGSRVLRGAALLFLLPLLPVLGFVRFDFQYISTVADHYLYLPMVGVALAGAWLLGRINWRVALPVAMAVFGFLAARSVSQINAWRDTDSLFHQALRVNPNSFVAYQNLAVEAYEKAQYPQAADLASSAIDRNPNDSAAYLTRAMALSRLGNVPAAIQTYELGLKHRADDASLLSNLAADLAERGELDRALVLARRAVRAEPDNLAARLNFGTLLARRGRTDDAIVQFRAAIALAPQSASAHANLGFTLAGAGNPEQAADEFRAALRINPDNPRIQQALRRISLAPRASTPKSP